MCALAWMSALRLLGVWASTCPHQLGGSFASPQGDEPLVGGTSSFTHPKGSPLSYLTADEMQNRTIWETKPRQALLQWTQPV